MTSVRTRRFDQGTILGTGDPFGQQTRRDEPGAIVGDVATAARRSLEPARWSTDRFGFTSGSEHGAVGVW